MQIVAKTGFDISIVKSFLLGKNVKKYFKMSSAEKKKKIPRLLRIKVLAFSIYIYNEKPSLFKHYTSMSFLQIILPCPHAAYCTFYMFESIDGLWVGGGERGRGQL